jgi:hypothetical protein
MRAGISLFSNDGGCHPRLFNPNRNMLPMTTTNTSCLMSFVFAKMSGTLLFLAFVAAFCLPHHFLDALSCTFIPV